MIRTFEVMNVKCGGCAHTLKEKLKHYKNVEVDLSVSPRKLTIDMEDEQIDELRVTLKRIGYPIIDDEMSRAEEMKTLISSYLSCIIGKMQN